MEKESVTCPNFGCNIRVARCHLKHHEERSCEYVQVRCRYVSFGCKWSGPRKSLALHEANDCSFARISGLVEQVRQLKSTNEQQQQQIHFVRNQLNQATQLIHLQGTTLMAMQAPKRSDNILDLCEGIFFCVYNPVYFMREKIVWRHLYATPSVRSKMYDAMFYLPSILVVIKIISNSLQDVKPKLGDALNAWPFSNSTTVSDILLASLEDVLLPFHKELLLGVIVCLCAWLAVISYLLDRRLQVDAFVTIGNVQTTLFYYPEAQNNSRNSREVRWSARLNPALHPPLWNYLASDNDNDNENGRADGIALFRDVHVVALTTIYVCAFSYYSFPKAFLIWVSALSTSIAFTCAVARIVHACRDQTSSTSVIDGQVLNLYRDSRGLAALQFALRYSFLISKCGLRETMYAVFFLEFIVKRTKPLQFIPEYVTMREQDFCLADPNWQMVINFAVIGHAALNYILCISSAKGTHSNVFAMMLLSEEALDQVLDVVLDYVEALCVLMLLNVCVCTLQVLGNEMGERMAMSAVQSVLAMQQDDAAGSNSRVVFRNRVNVDSSFVTLWWVFDLALILFL